MSDQPFSSEGFDLDAMADLTAASGTTSSAAASAATSANVVYEIGGGVSAVPVESPVVPATSDEISVTAAADDYKAQGNTAFRLQEWLEAADLYSKAVHALPGGSTAAVDLLKARDDWQAAQHALVRQKLAEEDAQRRQRKDAGEDDADAKDDKAPEGPPERFRAPHHTHASRLATFHANRSAAYMQLEEYEAALKDCDVAILWNPSYTKVYLRRATLHEKMERIDEALADTKAALLLDPGNRQIRAAVDRLQKMENERLEKLKEETMVRVKEMLSPDIDV
jgi:tetratricopeptide (TPR) repeat protein